MSLILDALNRSQRERESGGEIPGIETQHWVEPVAEGRTWRRYLPWLGLLVAGVIIVLLLLDRGIKEKPVSDSSGIPAVELAKRHPPLPSPAGQSVVKSSRPPERPSIEQAVKSAPESSTPEPLASSEVPRVTRKKVMAQTPASSNAIASLYAQGEKKKTAPTVVLEKNAAAPEAKTQEQTIDIEKMIALAKTESQRAELSEHPVPLLTKLSQQVKDQVPSIYYTQHDYSSNSSQSSVTLNGQVVRVGGTVGGKLKLVEILPDSIVLSHRGTEFRLRALNSWINL